jgi:sugar phosphate isomerase/epimerase
MFRYGAEILPYHDFDLETGLSELAKMGFKEVNLWSSAAPLAHHINPGDDTKKIRDLLDKYKMRPSGITTYGKTQQEMLDRIDLASEIGIDTMVFDCEANYADFVNKFLPPLVEQGRKKGVKIAVENHLTVPFSSDFETGTNEENRWDEGVDTLAQIKRLINEIDDPFLGVCIAPSHLWVMNETISEVITYLAERKRLFYYYIWDIDRNYKRGVDGLNFGPGEMQLPRIDGTLDHAVLLGTLNRVGYTGPASLKCHGTHGWSLEKVTQQFSTSNDYIKSCFS